jgi:hypothetical protein
MTSARSSPVEHRDDVLDETDPHAGDDAAWTDEDLDAAIAVALEPSSLLFWKGLALGLFLSAAAWCLLIAVAVVLYRVFAT